MQNSQVPVMLQLPWATDSSNKRTVPYTTSTPGAASWDLGFPQVCFDPYPPDGDGMAVDGLDVQGALNSLSSAIRWQCAGSVYPWNSAFSASTYVNGYPKGSRSSSSDFAFNWLSTVENNLTNPETTLTSIPTWVPEDASMLALTVAGIDITLTALQSGKTVIVLNGALTANITITIPLFPGMRWTFVCHYTNASSNVIRVTNVACTTYSPLIMGAHNATSTIVCNDDGSLSFSEADTSQEVANVGFLRNASYFIGSGGYERTIILNGYTTVGDSGGGLKFRWVWNGTLGYFADNGGTIFTSGAGGKGAWIALPGQDATALHFGADPTNTNDSTVALNNLLAWYGAVSSSPGKLTFLGVARIPAGVYKITSPLTVPIGIKVKGDGCGSSPASGSGYLGSGATTILCPSGVAMSVGPGAQLQTGISISDLRLSGTGSTGISLASAAQQVILENIIIDGFVSGAAFSNSSDVSIKNSLLYNNGTNLSLGANCLTINLNNCSLLSPTSGNQIAVSGSGCGNLNLTGCTISGGTLDHVAVQTGGSLRKLTASGNRILNITASKAFFFCATNTMDGANLDGNYWDAVTASTFVNVTSGNKNITVTNMVPGYSSSSGAQYVNFASGSVDCEAYLPSYQDGTVQNGVNASNLCRIYNRKADELGACYYANASQSFGVSATTVVTFNTMNFDPKSEFSGGTSYQPKDWGLYEIICNVTIVPFHSDDTYGLQIFNSSTSLVLQNNVYQNSNVSNFTLSAKLIVPLGPSDIILMQVVVGSDGGVVSVAGNANTSFSIRRVG